MHIRRTLLVNATPVGGMRDPSASPWPEALAYPSDLTLIDLVAWPLESRLVGQARAAGARAQGGLEMLVAQAARSFRLWTGLPSPLDVMRRAALQAAEHEGAG